MRTRRAVRRGRGKGGRRSVSIFYLIHSIQVILEYVFIRSLKRIADCIGGNQTQSGYRNRLLPTPQPHRQPLRPSSADAPAKDGLARQMITEPVWTQLVPQTRSTQYLLFWYIAETLPPSLDFSLPPPSSFALSSSEKTPAPTAISSSDPNPNRGHVDPPPYTRPAPFPKHLTIAERIAQEPEGYEPVRHENTGVNAEERLYESVLVPVEEAIRRLDGTVMADVVRRGWRGVRNRRFLEERAAKQKKGGGR